MALAKALEVRRERRGTSGFGPRPIWRPIQAIGRADVYRLESTDGSPAGDIAVASQSA